MRRQIGLTTAFVLTAIVLSTSSIAAPPKQAANPEFEGWSKFPVGASVTHVSVMNNGTLDITSEVVTVLVEKADDHVVIEATVTVKVGTTSRPRPPKRTTLRAQGDNPKKALADEKLEVAGEKFDCKVYILKETPPDAPASAKAEVKAWFSDKVPGGMVQTEIKTPTVNSKATLKSYLAK